MRRPASWICLPRPSSCSLVRAPNSSITWAMVWLGANFWIGIDPLVPQLLEFLQTLLTDLVG